MRTCGEALDRLMDVELDGMTYLEALGDVTEDQCRAAIREACTPMNGAMKR